MFPQLNPNTPLVFLPSSAAGQLEATRYLSVASLSAFVWDVLSNVGNDYRLFKKSRMSIPTLAYLLSRISSFGHILATTLFHTSPLSNCAILPVVIGIFWTIAIGSTSLLFFYRIKAVFAGNMVVISLFGLLWLVNLGGAITVPFALKAGNIANTPFCIPTGVRPFSSAGIITTACFDTLVFLAVSWRIIRQSAVDNRTASILKGRRHLPTVSRELLRGGQQYYLLTSGGNICIMVILLLSSTPPLLRDMFPVINLLLENSMACRVFRNIKLRKFREDRIRQLCSLPYTGPGPIRSPSAYGSEPIGEGKNTLTGSDGTVIEITKMETYPEAMEMFNSAAETV